MAKEYWMSADGFWHQYKPKEEQVWKSEKYHNYWKNWKGWGDDDGSWGCHECDTFQIGVVDTYKGMTADETHCNICHVHKGRSHSMPMAERARRIKAETYLPKEEARVARQERLTHR